MDTALSRSRLLTNIYCEMLPSAYVNAPAKTVTKQGSFPNDSFYDFLAIFFPTLYNC